MADHRQLVIERTAPMNVAVASPHWTQFRTEIRARDIDERFAKSRAARLIANQWCEDVAFTFVQKHSAGGAHRFLAAPEINAAYDHAAAIHGGEFVLENSRQQHP